jgi:hypothetical protein
LLKIKKYKSLKTLLDARNDEVYTKGKGYVLIKEFNSVIHIDKVTAVTMETNMGESTFHSMYMKYFEEITDHMPGV